MPDEFIVKVLLYIAGISPVIIGQILIYDRLKQDVAAIKLQINGLGVKVEALKEKQGERLTEEILRYSDLKDRVGKVEGTVTGFLNPKKTNGHA